MKKSLAISSILFAFITSSAFAASNDYAVESTGVDNTSTATQTNSTDYGTNSGFVVQDSSESDHAQDSSITQTNTADIVNGVMGNNGVTVDQKDLASSLSGNTSAVQQTALEKGGDNTATIKQVGGGNSSSVQQTANKGTNMAFVNQGLMSGTDYNTATIIQLNSLNPLAGTNSATINQDGLNGDVTIDQNGENNLATTTTTGTGIGVNLVNVKQTGSENATFLTVTGQSNIVSVDQSGMDAFSSATATVVGDDNVLDFTQSGVNESSILNVTGNGNSGLIVQTGTNDSNSSTVTGNLNTLNLAQSGSDGFIMNTVSGNDNILSVNQSGTAGSSTIDVTGNVNIVNVAQSGISDISSVTVSGSNQMHTVTQN